MGVSIFGFGSPALANPNIGAAFANDTTGAIESARMIDPLTKDYKISPVTGRLVGGSDVQQLVYLALATISNSSAVQNLGQGLSKIKLITSNIQRRIESEIELALSKLTKANLISLDSVVVERTPTNLVKITVKWTDLAKSKPEITALPLI